MKKRIYTIASETGRSNQAILEAATRLGFAVTSVSSGLTEDEEATLLASFQPKKAKPKPGSSKVKVIRKKASQYNQHNPPQQPKQSAKTSALKNWNSAYEKKPRKKEPAPKVKTVSQARANHLFVFLLVCLTAVLLGLGALGMASDLRVNQLVKDTNRVLAQLSQDNQKQAQAIKALQQGSQGTQP